MFDWIPDLLLAIATNALVLVILGLIIGFSVRDLLQEWQDRKTDRLLMKALPLDAVEEDKEQEPLDIWVIGLSEKLEAL